MKISSVFRNRPSAADKISAFTLISWKTNLVQTHLLTPYLIMTSLEARKSTVVISGASH